MKLKVLLHKISKVKTLIKSKEEAKNLNIIALIHHLSPYVFIHKLAYKLLIFKMIIL